ncbi:MULTISPECIES: DUF2955 domain-containing protein [unclassified Cupriavidus]|uniref:DUF2955 domain-containing protein n=1 Tax=unclassified Cupriavidus TaxID=2640874 RepID=UPI0028B92F80|nr:DUF2955 domain-containing protein [Cupriavidus sp. SZY C1]MDT6963365.1 DUF2955 domain-containing protein [Cupriavidus sp. SZY C1]
MSTDAAAAPALRAAMARRALRLALGTAGCLAVSFGLQWPVPVMAPVLAVFVFAALDRPLPLKAGLGLALVVMLATGSGLLLVPFLRHAPAAGVLMAALCLFLAFRYGLRGGNGLVSTFVVAGVTLIAAAGTASGALALTVIGALTQGLTAAVLALGACHALVPEHGAPAPRPPPRAVPDADRIAWRATLVVMPPFLLALSDPAAYLPIIMKAVSLGRQSCTTARGAALELVGSTLMGGLLAIACWLALGLFVHLWMFFLWMALFALLVARRLFRVAPTALSPGFWLNSLVTMIILLGQSVADSAAGKDVYQAFMVRMGLFVAVSLYAWLMLALLDRPRAVAAA